MRTILLNPGPVTLSARVRAALSCEDVCHREPEFAALTLEIKQRLGAVYAAASDYEAVLLTSSGTGAVEAMLSSLIPHSGKALVVANGVYGERMAAMITAHGKPLRVVSSDWLAAIDLEAVERALQSDPAITHVVAVHHETTTGRLNAIAALGRLCRQHNVALLLDAISSFGAEAIDIEGWNLEACAGTANKCLHGAPGISFVLARRAALLDRPTAAATLYLDLQRYANEQRSGYSPFTQAVHVAYALREALAELDEAGGWQARQQLFATRAALVRDGLAALDIAALLDPPESSCVLSAFHLPTGCSYEQLHDDLKAAGFVIYAGQGMLKQQLFRIAHMGNFEPADMQRLLRHCAARVRGVA